MCPDTVIQKLEPDIRTSTLLAATRKVHVLILDLVLSPRLAPRHGPLQAHCRQAAKSVRAVSAAAVGDTEAC